MASDVPGDSAGDHDRAKIVVGIDGSRGSHEALCHAVEEARLRGGFVYAVHAWQYPFQMAAGAYVAPVESQDVERWARQVLDEAIAAVEIPQEVDVVLRAEMGSPTFVLLMACQGAELLVLGSRGHRQLTGLFIGSVSQHMVAHAPCPVLVVPTPNR